MAWHGTANFMCAGLPALPLMNEPTLRVPPALQRVNFPALTSQCQPGTSCTACFCQLSSAMAVANSDPMDLALCIRDFRQAAALG